MPVYNAVVGCLDIFSWTLPITSDQGSRNSSLARYTPDVSLSFEHHAGDSTFLISSTPPQGWSGVCCLSSPSTNLTRGLAASRPPSRKGTIHLQTSMSSPGFEPKPYGIAVSVTNHSTRWTTRLNETNNRPKKRAGERMEERVAADQHAWSRWQRRWSPMKV
ncbi:hypothetical protein TNCV_226331 [Trichonephila clavipes]|nr:hypothetical protein TNCV_226331 [Trichonephila clavipes]